MDHTEANAMRAAERYVLGDLSVSEVEEFERHFFDCPQCSEELRLLSVLQENARAVFMEPLPGPLAQPEPAPAPQVEADRTDRFGWQDDELRLVDATPSAKDMEPLFADFDPISAEVERTEHAVHPPVPAVPQSLWTRIANSWKQPWTFAPALAAVAIALVAGYFAGTHQDAGAPRSISSFPLYAASRGEETVVAPPAASQFYTLYMDRTWDRDSTSYRAVITAEGSTAEKYSIPVAAIAPGQSVQVLVPIRALPAGRYVLAISGQDGAPLARYPFVLQIH
jgi:hypothetical protein